MKRYLVKYADCGETHESYHSAYDYEHAEEKFWESIIDWQGDTLGIEVLSVTLAKKTRDKIKTFYAVNGRQK